MPNLHSAPSLPDTLKILHELDSGFFNSTEWLKTVHRSLICDESTHPEHTAEDAHRHCDFGRWYYGKVHEQLASDPAFQHIEQTHQSMHDAARALLLKKGGHAPVPAPEYDAFMDQAIAFKREIRKLQFDLINRVCVVDHLTGAWNRTGMYSRLTQEQERMGRSGLPGCICMMDLDHFKRINDQHGHAAGDQVLHASVQFISSRLRNYDSIFRYGGEEFLICLPDIQLIEAGWAMDRLRMELEQFVIPLANGQPLTITASFGVAEMNADIPIQDTINMADHALLCAKAQGRNRVSTWGIEE
jgi:diguanylate cyclase (GGDEF)-like protein